MVFSIFHWEDVLFHILWSSLVFIFLGMKWNVGIHINELDIYIYIFYIPQL